MQSLSVFCIVKNEAQFIEASVRAVAPYVDEIVYADGNSTDGTLSILDRIGKEYPNLRVLKNWDCANLQDDYVRLFNELLGQCKGDYVWFLHPDMVVRNPAQLTQFKKQARLDAYTVRMRSFAGDGMVEITKGRTNTWKTIMRNAYGLHYWGHYGNENEDMYFDFQDHKVYRDLSQYPFEIGDSRLCVEHYCECKDTTRRKEKMENILKYGHGIEDRTVLTDALTNHPRVTLKSESNQWGSFKFQKRKDPLPSGVLPGGK